MFVFFLFYAHLIFFCAVLKRYACAIWQGMFAIYDATINFIVAQNRKLCFCCVWNHLAIKMNTFGVVHRKIKIFQFSFSFIVFFATFLLNAFYGHCGQFEIAG